MGKSNKQTGGPRKSGRASRGSPGKGRRGKDAREPGLLGRFFVEHAWIVAITVLGAALRWIGLGRRGLWVDEVVTWNLTRNGLFDPLDEHGLYFSLVRLSISLFGEGESALRLASAVMGVACIPVIHACALRLWGKREGLIAASAVAVSNWLILFSQEARFYSALFLFTALMLFALLSIWKTGRFRYLILLVVCIPILRGIHPTALVFAGVASASVGLWFALWPAGRATFWKWLTLGRGKWDWRAACATVALTALVAAGGYYAYRIGLRFGGLISSLSFENSTENVELTPQFFLRHYRVFSLGPVRVAWLWIVPASLQLIAFVWGWLRAARRELAFALMLVSLLSATFLLLFSYETFQPYELKYSMFFYPPMLVLLAGGLIGFFDAVGRRASGRVAAAIEACAVPAAIVVILIAGFAEHFPNRSREYAGFKRAIEAIEQRHAEGDSIVAHDFGRAPVQYQLLRSSIGLEPYLMLEAEQGGGAIESARILALAMSNKEVWCVSSINWRIPVAFKQFLETHFEVEERYPSIWGNRFEVQLMRWRWPGRTVSGIGRVEIDLEGGLPVGGEAPASVSIYVARTGAYELTALADGPLTLLAPAAEEVRSGGESAQGATMRATVFLEAGIRELQFGAAEGDRTATEVHTIAIEPILDRTLIVEAENASRFAFPARFEMRNIQGRRAMAYTVNSGAEYDVVIPASGLAKVDLVGLHDKPGAVVFSVGIDGTPQGLIGFLEATGEWDTRTLIVRAAPGRHRLNVDFLSDEGDDAGGDLDIDGFLDRIEWRGVTLEEARRTKEDRVDPAQLINDPGAAFDPRLPPLGTRLTSTTRWAALADSDMRVVTPGFSPEAPALRLDLPRKGMVGGRSPAFKVQPDRWIYYTFEIATEGVINHTANASLMFTDAGGKMIHTRAYYTSKAGINNTLHWREGINHVYQMHWERIAGMQRVPQGASLAAILLLAYDNGNQPLDEDGVVWYRNLRIVRAEELAAPQL